MAELAWTLSWQTGHTLSIDGWIVRLCRARRTSNGVSVELFVSMKCSLTGGSIEAF